MTSGSSFGSGIAPSAADVISSQLVSGRGNEALQWSEGSYRGFFTLEIGVERVEAVYYGMRNVSE